MSRGSSGEGESKGSSSSVPLPLAETLVQPVPLDRAPICAVTVYTEAVAEILRRVPVDGGVAPPGSTVELVLKGLTKNMDKNSVRVSGQGPAKILNVSAESTFYSSDHTQSGPVEDEAVKRLKEELQDSKSTRNLIVQEMNRIDRRCELVQNYSSSAANGTRGKAGGDKDTDKPLTLNGFKELLDFYVDTNETADGKRNELRGRLEELEKKIVALERQIAERGKDDGHAIQETCNVSITIEVTGPGAIELDLRYLVRGAQWHASYDVRISSSSEERSVVLTYYGIVSQSTDEDWLNVHLSLSTATPSKGGLPPSLPTRHAKFYTPAAAYGYPKSRMQTRKTMAKDYDRGELEECEDFVAQSQSAPLAGGALRGLLQEELAVHQTAAVEGGGGMTAALGPSTFTIHKLSTVKSDRKPQKVTIGILTLASTFRHYVVPSKETNAYLQSKTVNSSDYTLMPSNDVSIFFDNNFVAKTELKLVQPGEEFQAFLGVDPAVRVDYLPPKTLTSSVGLFSSKKVKSYETMTSISNQKGIPVTVAVVESLPLSQNDKIKVTLTTPATDSLREVSFPDDVDVGSGEAEGTYLNKDTNNLVFVREVKSKAKVQLPFRYTLEWPHGSEVVVEATPREDLKQLQLYNLLR